MKMSSTDGVKAAVHPNDATLPVYAVAVKLSPVCSRETASWFRRAEVQFRLRKITDPHTKADYLLEAVPEDIFPRVAAWLDNRHKDIEYDAFKSYLLQEFTPNVSAAVRSS